MHSDRKLFTKIFGTLALVAAVALSGCATTSPTVFSPASTNASEIHNLIILIFEIAAVVFVVVESLLIYATIRFSRQRKDAVASSSEGNRKLEIAWTLAPAIVLAIVFVISLKTLNFVGYRPIQTQAGKNDPTPIHVQVIGHQWWWEFKYPELGIDTANEMHVPVGGVINVDVESVDVIHSYWVPQLGGKLDAIPGHVNKTWFQPTIVGTYHGQCAEFCGLEHGDMRFNVIVETPEQFQTWVKQQQAPVATMNGAAAQGEQVFLNGACIGCHTIDGTKAQGKVGPNLTHLASRNIFAGGIMQTNRADLSTWLADPQKVKPGTLMPNLHLSQDQINQLVTFLENLK
jgi:cytochrome c oxidase subunit 2